MTTNKSKGGKKSIRSGKARGKNDLSLRGRSFKGTVVSARMQRTVTVEWERRHFLKKYERYEKRKSTAKAHNPDNVNAKEGDVVRIMECRPMSKTKNFIVVEVMGRERGFKERMEAEKESKAKKAVKEELAETGQEKEQEDTA